jgi:hypothetical protein
LQILAAAAQVCGYSPITGNSRFEFLKDAAYNPRPLFTNDNPQLAQQPLPLLPLGLFYPFAPLRQIICSGE